MRRWTPLLWATCALAGCHRPAPEPEPPSQSTRETTASPLIAFTDVTAAAGIDFVHRHGGWGQRLMPETVGSGVAWLDYDGDGWQDLVFAQFRSLPGAPKPVAATSQLYRNRGDGTFENSTAGSGLEVPMFGMGVAAADYDGDGDIDLFLTCLGPNVLLRNDGDGRFVDVTARAGVADGDQPWRWHTGAAWLDYDRDGWLDLFVARYVVWTPATDRFCGVRGQYKKYCPPFDYPEEKCALYRNRGDGSFEDVSHAMGVDAVTGYWFQPLAWDYNGDGWPDVVVTSDTTATALWRNVQGRRFVDVAPETGVSVSDTGSTNAGMGVDLCDWRNIGAEALLIGNFDHQGLNLFERESDELYAETSISVGMRESSFLSLTFGLAFIDLELDGWADAFIGNGHIDDLVEMTQSNVTYAQRPLVYHNQNGERFVEIGEQIGAPMTEQLVVRGCALADYDRDGDIDIVVAQNNRPARLYRNDTAGAGHWLRVALRQPGPNRFAIGAKVTVSAAGRTQFRYLRAGQHFLSTSEPVLHFGLGAATRADVRVTWPDGKTTEFPQMSADSEHTLRRD